MCPPFLRQEGKKLLHFLGDVTIRGVVTDPRIKKCLIPSVMTYAVVGTSSTRPVLAFCMRSSLLFALGVVWTRCFSCNRKFVLMI